MDINAKINAIDSRLRIPKLALPYLRVRASLGHEVIC